MINFTVGPVQMFDCISKIGSEPIPYFRTDDFSSMMKSNESMILDDLKAPDGSAAIFLTGSGTAAMEATVLNLFTSHSKVLIVNGGSFGARFVEICKTYSIPFEEIIVKIGENISEEQLTYYANKGFTGLLVNACETSIGTLYNLQLLSSFCRENNILFVVDAISAFLSDPIDMKKLGINAIITSSQKALACPPGISIIALDSIAIDVVKLNFVPKYYLDLKRPLLDGLRGQTPFTPAVGILIQINERLKMIKSNGGVESEIKRTQTLAMDFRKKIIDYPFEFVTKYPSNAVTSLHPTTAQAYDIFIELMKNYSIWVCPNGGVLSNTMFRVGHIGNLTINDNDELICAFSDMVKRKKL